MEINSDSSVTLDHDNVRLWYINLRNVRLGNRDSAVSIAIGYGLDDRGFGVRVPGGSRIFTSPRRPDRLWRSTQSPIQWVPGALFPGVKRQGREAHHSPPTNAEVKQI
jgi:hypothetical protein